MSKKITFIIFSIFIFLQGYNAIENDRDRHIREFDNGKYRLEWFVDNSVKRIFFNVTVQTLGFVGFGISKRENNGLVDLVIGGVDRGKAYFSDGNIKPPQAFLPETDNKQDWTLHSSWESRSHTFLSFSRAFDTCDPEDVPFDDDTVTLHYIYGETDNILEYYRAAHGTIPVYLRDPDLIPLSLTTPNGQHPTKINGRKVSIWNINSNRIIPANKTSYICTIKKLSLLRKHHILGFNVRINDESLPHIHHIVFNRCHVPSSMGTASSIFETVLDTEELCYFSDPQRKIRGAFCTDAKIGFAIGNGPTFFPDPVGLPIGESGEDEYFLMQVHYDNQQQRNDINSQLNIDIYYSPQLRKNDGGILTIGANVPVPQSILIPPGEKNHDIYGRCSSRCTNLSLPQAGIKMVAGFLHAHSAGRKLRLSHYRNGRELKYLMNDENYENQYQPWRLNKEEVTILPGDEMTTRCSYDTTERQSSLVGGFATYQEMCVSFILYYGKLDFPFCGSDIMFPQYTAKYLAGASNLTWNEAKLEFVANAPSLLTGMTVSEISDSNYVNWSWEKRQELKIDHFALDQVEYCAYPGRDELAFLQARRTGQLGGLPANFVSYPRATPYITERTCHSNNHKHFQPEKSDINFYPSSNSRNWYDGFHNFF